MILIVDVSSLAHRIYHVSHQNDVNGEPCGVPSGFFRTMARITTELKESFLEPITKVACMDFGRCLWRTELYPEYKAKRDRPQVTDFAPQMSNLETALPQFGFQVCKAYGTEADDLIGVVSQELEKNTNENICIVSSDKDLWQLITNRVKIYDLSKDMIVGAKEAEELLGFSHERLVEYKALAGDSSDNIPGAKGIGEKGAKKILAEYPNLQEVLDGIRHSIGDEEPDEGILEGLATPELRKVAKSMGSIRLAGKLCTIAQYPDQLWDDTAKDAVSATVQTVINGQTPAFDDVATSILAELWRTDGTTWHYAFKS